MILYLSIIFIMAVLISLWDYFWLNGPFGLSMWFIILSVVLNIIFVIVVDAIIAILSRIKKPETFDVKQKSYQVSDKEKHFLEKMQIKKWKDHIPEMGRYLCHFPKDKVYEKNNNLYVHTFIVETIYAEKMHFWSIFLGFLIVFFYPLKYVFLFGLPVAIVNAFLQLWPVLVQRYNRYKLIHLYIHNERKSMKVDSSKLS